MTRAIEIALARGRGLDEIPERTSINTT